MVSVPGESADGAGESDALTKARGALGSLLVLWSSFLAQHVVLVTASRGLCVVLCMYAAACLPPRHRTAVARAVLETLERAPSCSAWLRGLYDARWQ